MKFNPSCKENAVTDEELSQREVALFRAVTLYCLLLQGENGGRMVFRKVGILSQQYTVSKHIRHRLEYS
jgi:hypothetical protein